jgi:quercetin dioxygenase-like cupin family protein
MPKLNRHVVGSNDEGRSAILSSDITNSQYKEGFYWRSTLWATTAFPPNNATDKDISADVIAREPAPSGLIFRALEIAPDDKDPERHRQVLAELNSTVGQRVAPSEADLTRHPNMHRTGTLDFTTCVIGEIYLVTDVDEVLMTPGDTVIIRGTNHAWSNRSDKPCLLMVAMVDAQPK